jgi:hypothetical protein
MIIGNLIGIGNNQSTAAPTFDLSKIVIQYNNTDYSYMTNGGALRPDITSIRTNSNLIEVYKVSANADANTGLTHDPATDKIVVMEYQGAAPTNGKAKFFNRDGTLDHEVSLIGSSQGIGIDPIGGRLFGYFGNSASRITVYDLSGNYIEEFSPTAGYTGGACQYDYRTGKLYVTDTGSSSGDTQRVLVYERLAGTWTLTDTLWFACGEGLHIDFIRDKFCSWSLSPTGGIDNIFSVPMEGELIYEQYNVPINSGFKEGLICDPKDGTYWINIDDGFHAAVTDGNDVWHFDPRKVYQKYLRFPDMISYDYFKLGTAEISGNYNAQTVTASDWITSPVIDFAAHTLQQNGANWSIDEDHEIEYRSSTSAPSTTRITAPYLGTTGYYDANGSNDGWGSTTPSAWGASIPTDRYVQFRIKPLETAPVTPDWTPADLGEDLVLWYEFDSDYSAVAKVFNASDNSLNFYQAFNKANPGTNDTTVVTVSTNQPQWNAATTAMRMGSRTFNINSPSSFLAQQQGEINAVGAKLAAGTQGVIVIGYDTANAGDNQFCFEHYASTDAAANAVGARVTDGVEAVIFKSASPADANLSFKLRTLSSDGSTQKAFINKVEQTLTISAGSNTGQWFGDTSANDIRLARRSATSGNVGGYDYRMIVWTNRVLTTQERSDLYDYAVRKGFI